MAAVACNSRQPDLAQRLAALDQGQRLRLALGVALFVAIGIVGLVMGRQAEWRVLYANLADKDGGAIIAQLSQLNVPYKHAEGGDAILVPADKVHDTRLRLASQGLPKGSVAGFEMMEANRFGMTQFQERLTLPAWPRRRADALDPGAVVGAECPGAPGPAQPERLFPRAAEAVGLGAAQPAPRPYAGSQTSWPASSTWSLPACRR